MTDLILFHWQAWVGYQQEFCNSSFIRAKRYAILSCHLFLHHQQLSWPILIFSFQQGYCCVVAALTSWTMKPKDALFVSCMPSFNHLALDITFTQHFCHWLCSPQPECYYNYLLVLHWPTCNNLTTVAGECKILGQGAQLVQVEPKTECAGSLLEIRTSRQDQWHEIRQWA